MGHFHTQGSHLNHTATQESQQGLSCPYPMEEVKAQTRQIIDSMKMTDVRSTQLSLLANCFSIESIKRLLVNCVVIPNRKYRCGAGSRVSGFNSSTRPSRVQLLSRFPLCHLCAGLIDRLAARQAQMPHPQRQHQEEKEKLPERQIFS